MSVSSTGESRRHEQEYFHVLHEEKLKLVTLSGEHFGNFSNASEVNMAHDTIILFLGI